LSEGNDSPALFVKEDAVVVDSSSGAFSLFLQPDDLFTLTTLTTGSKGNHPTPPAQGMQLPYLQTFENETAHAPPRLWYDVQGAWEIHDSGDPGHGKVMKQMSSIWPAGWHGPPWAGPTTYFGPGDNANTAIKPGVAVSFSIMLAEDAAVSFGVGEPGGKGNPNPAKNLKASIDSVSGNWTLGDVSGNGARFASGIWHNISLSMGSVVGAGAGVGSGESQLLLDGAVLGNTSKVSTGAFELVLSRYINAMVDNFAVRR
jgi:hypothetical protein